MNYKCPHCGSIVEREIVLPPMNLRRRRIYKAVAAAGEDGISVTKLLRRMYDGAQPTPGGKVVLRVAVYELNKVLLPLQRRIKTISQHYYLIRTD